MAKLYLKAISDTRKQKITTTGKDKIFTEFYYDEENKNRNLLVKFHRNEEGGGVLHITGEDGTIAFCNVTKNHRVTCKSLMPDEPTMKHSFIDWYESER